MEGGDESRKIVSSAPRRDDDREIWLVFAHDRQFYAHYEATKLPGFPIRLMEVVLSSDNAMVHSAVGRAFQGRLMPVNEVWNAGLSTGLEA